MERFVQLIVTGGVALVAGLWLVRILDAGSPPWLVGAGLVVLGVGGLASGIWSEVEC